eukprot:8213509-Lingulodinium_polyedra.AAC.1
MSGERRRCNNHGRPSPRRRCCARHKLEEPRAPAGLQPLRNAGVRRCQPGEADAVPVHKGCARVDNGAGVTVV